VLGDALARIREHWQLGGASDHGVSEALYLTNPEGIGIGPSLVATLVDQFGADVSIENNDSDGPVFGVELLKIE
jgi:sensor histidine kinase regulating citrate/malate metabolism